MLDSQLERGVHFIQRLFEKTTPMKAQCTRRGPDSIPGMHVFKLEMRFHRFRARPCANADLLGPFGARPSTSGTVLLMTALLLSSASGSAIAQTNTGEVTGVIRDISGGVLPDATVTARHGATGFVVERVTDSAGRFFLPALRTGEWDITASLAGFAPQTQKGIVLEMGRTLNLEFRLALEGVTENVTVAVSAPLLQTNTAEISDIIENRQVVQFPLNGRNFLPWRSSVTPSCFRPAVRAGMRSSRPVRCPTSADSIGPQHLPAGRCQGYRRAL
jgi:Carboxypeptidase regulatory-like domain